MSDSRFPHHIESARGVPDKWPRLWGYAGACERDNQWATFSVGIFPILTSRYGKRLKRGKVQKRISGPTIFPEAVYQKAEEWIAMQEAGRGQ